MKLVAISYTNGKGTSSEMSASEYAKLQAWYLNPKSCKTYLIVGNNDLLIHKDQIAYMLVESN